MTDPTYLAQFLHLLDDSFDEEELRTLAFELGISYDNIAGTTKEGKARELISALDRQGRMSELLILCARKRPNVAWPELPRSQLVSATGHTADSFAQAPQIDDSFAVATDTQPTSQPQESGQERKSSNNTRLIAAGALILVIIIGVSAIAIGTSLRSGGPASAEGMIRIPTGTYQIGSEAGGASYEPDRTMGLNAYLIDKYEVTNAQYAKFVAADGPQPQNWSGGSYPAGEAAFPVTGISWDMADEYCKWLNKRLPQEAEWEVAARGDQGLLFPWGDSSDQVKLPEESPYPVGTFLADHSSYGLFDMAHNVHEWVGEPYTQVETGKKVLRGGSSLLPVNLVTRIVGDPNAPTMTPQAGFRCAVDADETVDYVSPDLVFLDNFTDPETGWTVGAGDNPGYHTPDWYHLEARTSDPIVLLGPEGNSNRGDISLLTEIFLSQAQTINDGGFRYGLLARKHGDQSYYAFMISPNDKSWSVMRQTPDGPIEIASGPEDSIAGSETPNWLRLDSSGQTFLFWVNGKLAYQFTDPEAPLTGDIGYIVESLGASQVHVHADYLEVTNLVSNPIPAPTVNAGS